MKKKSQIRKYTVQKIKDILQVQTNHEVLQLYIEHIKEKINPLIQKKKLLTQQLHKSRKKTQGIIRQMNDGFRSRVQKTQTIIMSAHSRPTKDDAQHLTNLFIYMENQDKKIMVNSNDINITLARNNQILNSLTVEQFNYQELDNKYNELNKKCSDETKLKQQVQQILLKNRQFYKKIDQSIQKCRQEYEIVQSKIRDQQKQLDNLRTYFNLRQRQDNQNIERQNQLTQFLESQLLNAQSIVNFNSIKDQGLKIIGIQGKNNE